MKAKLRGTEIYFDIAGMHLRPEKNGIVEKPVVFLLHGGPGGDHMRYKQLSLELQDVAQLVFIDHRGCGRSKKTKQSDYTMENNIEDIEALRNYLGLNKICILGTSYGGMVAQGYATRYPKNVEKLILVVTAPSFRFLQNAKDILAVRGNAEQKAICEHLWNGTFKSHQHLMRYFELMEPLYSTGKKPQITFSKTKTQWSHQALNEGFGNFLKKFDFTPTLKKIKCPTLIMAGDKDWICSPEQSKIIAKHIPQAKLKIFKDSGHTVAGDVHDEYIKLAKKFLMRG